MVDTLPKIALIGRPNVGKSTLFNRLIGKRQAIVDDIPGVTRDRHYGECRWNNQVFTLIDTGGFVPQTREEDLEAAVRDQVQFALEEADGIVFVTDGRAGMMPSDKEIALILRKAAKPIFLSVNKIDTAGQDSLVSEFYRLGFSEVFPVSAESGRGVDLLAEKILSSLRPPQESPAVRSDVKLAIVGQPNVGKSTLLNALIGAERAVVFPQAGTTRDPLNIVVERGSRLLEFVDTAGIKRKSRTTEKLEKIGAIKAIQSVEKADIALVVVDADQGITNQDAKILGYAEENGKGIILIFNKWDLVKPGTELKVFREHFYQKFKRLRYVPVIALSAKTKRGIKNLYSLIDQIFENYLQRIGTGPLNRILQKAMGDHPPPLISGKAPQVYYGTQAGGSPPRIVLFCNHPKLVKEDYLRYLERVLRERFTLNGVPIRWILRLKK